MIDKYITITIALYSEPATVYSISHVHFTEAPDWKVWRVHTQGFLPPNAGLSERRGPLTL